MVLQIFAESISAAVVFKKVFCGTYTPIQDDNYESTYREYWSPEVGRRAVEAACPRDPRGIDEVRKNGVLPNVAHPDRRFPLQNRVRLKVGRV